MEIVLDIIAIWVACSLLLAVGLSAVIRRERELRPQRVPVARETRTGPAAAPGA
jgi:hypothetical protein